MCKIPNNSFYLLIHFVNLFFQLVLKLFNRIIKNVRHKSGNFWWTSTFMLHIFLWLDIVSGVKSVKLSNATIGNSGNWAQVSKREKGIAKRTFFWNMSFNILEIRNPFFDIDKIWDGCAWPQEETFQSFRNM